MPPENATRASKPSGTKPSHNTGFRVTSRQRFELEVAAPYLGTHSLQDTLAVALEEFLDRMSAVEGFVSTLASAEAHQQSRAGVERVDGRGGDR